MNAEKLSLIKSFRATTPDQALRYCSALSADAPGMLVTRDLRGLRAGQLDEVCAVFFLGEQSPALRAEAAAWTEDAYDSLDSSLRKENGSSRSLAEAFEPVAVINADSGKMLPPAIREEMEFQLSLAPSMIEGQPSSALFGSLDGILRPHSDRGDTLHGTIAGNGLKVFYQRAASFEQLNPFRFVDSARGTPGHTTGPGDIVYFKGWMSDTGAPQGRAAGVVHCLDESVLDNMDPRDTMPDVLPPPRLALASYW